MGLLLSNTWIKYRTAFTTGTQFSVPYSFFHWGISAWATYTLASLIMAYHFHVRKTKV